MESPARYAVASSSLCACCAATIAGFAAGGVQGAYWKKRHGSGRVVHAGPALGRRHVLKVNPGVQIYTPVKPANFDTPVGPGLANVIRRRVDAAPDDMHYSDGKVPQRIAAGSPWPGAKFVQIRTPGAARLLPVLDGVGGDRHR